MSITYKDSGVDIEAGNALVKRIIPMVKQTHRAGVASNLGGFGGLFDLKAEKFNDPILVSGTDGVGTKLKIAIDSGIHHTVGIDLVAMCVNDVLVQGALPLFFLDYFATGGLDVDDAATVISGIVEGCKQSGAALLGGETAEMPGFYPNKHYDLAGFCVGAVERDALLPKMDQLKPNDVVIGLPSSGFHSNGFSLVRKIAELNAIKFTDPCPWHKEISFAEALLQPTKIYVETIKPLLDKNLLKALSHITGGGLTENLPRILPDTLGFSINLDAWVLTNCFKWAMETGNISRDEMLKTFNCGIGMALVVDQNDLSKVTEILEKNHNPFFVIGHIIEKGQADPSVHYSGSL